MSKPRAPEGETTEQRFTRVAGLRTSNIVEGLELLGTMGPDVPNDAYTAQAFGAIETAFVKAKEAWVKKDAAAKKRIFSFGPGDQASLPNVPAKPPAKK